LDVANHRVRPKQEMDVQQHCSKANRWQPSFLHYKWSSTL